MSKVKKFITKGAPEVMYLMVIDPGQSKMQRKEVVEDLRDECEMYFDHTISANELVCVIKADMCCLFMHEMKKEKRSSNVRNKKDWLFMAKPDEEVVGKLPVVEVYVTPKYGKGQCFRRKMKGGVCRHTAV